jgi:hypothetical protein
MDPYLDQNLKRAQDQIKRLNHMIRQMKDKPEFSDDLAYMSKMEGTARQAEEAIQSARNSSLPDG